MKIGSLDNPALVNATNGDRKAQAPAKDTPRAGAEPSATVAISAQGSQLSAAMADPTFDADKVQRLAQAIKDGKFEVNADKIADKLISNAAELVSRRYSS